jgi:hypothetical protein
MTTNASLNASALGAFLEQSQTTEYWKKMLPRFANFCINYFSSKYKHFHFFIILDIDDSDVSIGNFVGNNKATCDGKAAVILQCVQLLITSVHMIAL